MSHRSSPITAKLPGLQNVKSAGLQAHGSLEVCLAAVSLLCMAWRVLLSAWWMAASAHAHFLLGHSGRDLSPHLHEELLKDFQTECNEYPGLGWF